MEQNMRIYTTRLHCIEGRYILTVASERHLSDNVV